MKELREERLERKEKDLKEREWKDLRERERELKERHVTKQRIFHGIKKRKKTSIKLH